MKKLKLSLLSFLIIFIGVINVSAANQTTGAMAKSDNRFKFNGTSIVDVSEVGDNAIFYKYSGNNSYTCISGIEIPIEKGESCTFSSSLVDSTKQIGAAYIIEKMTGITGGIANMYSLREKYYWLEIAILKYLDKADAITLTDDVINAQIRNISGLTYNELKRDADAYAVKYSKKLDIRFELEDGSDSLKFTEGTDAAYYSQKIYIKEANGQNYTVKNDGITNESKADLIKGTDAKGSYYQIKIDKANLSGNSITTTLMVDVTSTYYVASFYDCVQGQDLMSTVTEKKTYEDTISIGTTQKSTKLTIYKRDANGDYLDGVVLKVESKDNNYSKDFITGDEPLVLTDLEYGTYTITEISAPGGYSILKEPKTVTLSEDKLSEEVTLVNNLNRVEIRKINANDGSLLEGAILQIQTEDGEVIEEWETTNKAYVIEGLEIGTYYLVEISAPEGFELNEEKIKFVIDDTTEIEEIVMENNLEVEVPDTLSSRSALLIVIAMFDIALGIGILTYVKTRKVEE